MTAEPSGGGVDTGQPETFVIRVRSVNDAPSFASGKLNIITRSGERVSGPWASRMSIGPANETGQSFQFSVQNSAMALFSRQPSIDRNGILTFLPKEDAVGSANVVVKMTDNGGTENGGADTSISHVFQIEIGAAADDGVGLEAPPQ